jgi:hypothetical protein
MPLSLECGAWAGPIHDSASRDHGGSRSRRRSINRISLLGVALGT